MASGIDSTKPVAGSPTTESVRSNFTSAKNEINSLLRSNLDAAAAGGSVDALTADYANNVARVEGQRIVIRASGANTTAVTLNVDSSGVSPVVKVNGAALVANEIGGAQHYLDLMWSSSTSSWILMNPLPSPPSESFATARTIAIEGDAVGTVQFDGSINVSMDVDLQLQGLLKAYPIGSIYTSAVATSPSTYFGGTWVSFGAGKVLVGLDAADADFDTAEETGGSKTHTLTTSEMPAHTHTMTIENASGSGSSGSSDGSSSFSSVATSSTGAGAAHNNVQPYIVVYMWKRTA
jgi:hypothetical protein